MQRVTVKRLHVAGEDEIFAEHIVYACPSACFISIDFLMCGSTRTWLSMLNSAKWHLITSLVEQLFLYIFEMIFAYCCLGRVNESARNKGPRPKKLACVN